MSSRKSPFRSFPSLKIVIITFSNSAPAIAESPFRRCSSPRYRDYGRTNGQYVSVKDTGAGILEEEIPIVLASFGQGSNSIKSAEQGAGLGWPIAKSLV